MTGTEGGAGGGAADGSPTAPTTAADGVPGGADAPCEVHEIPDFSLECITSLEDFAVGFWEGFFLDGRDPNNLLTMLDALGGLKPR